LALAAALGAAALPADARRPADHPCQGSPPFEVIKGLPKHCGTYPRFNIAWTEIAFAERVRAVYAHPLLPRRAIVVTDRGLYASDDAGGTWRALKAAAVERISRVEDVAFSPTEPETLLLATAEKGIWSSRDGGKALSQVGSEKTGLASDATLTVTYQLSDPRLKTVLVGHGREAPGLSRSLDGGKSWDVLHGDYHVYRIDEGRVRHGLETMFVAATRRAPDVRNVYNCAALGDHWMEIASDVVLTDMVTPHVQEIRLGGWSGRPVFFTTLDAGLFLLSKIGATQIGPDHSTKQVSVGVTYGRNADQELIFTYDTRKLGLVVSTSGMERWSSLAAGLPTGPFVREGAHIRANANGTVFYAAANHRLWQGRVYTGPDPLSDIAVTPPVVMLNAGRMDTLADQVRARLATVPRRRRAAEEVEKLLRALDAYQELMASSTVRVTAKVAGRNAPKSVTVDLSRIGGAARTPMLDDGAHGDGQAGDGVYGAVHAIDPRSVRQRNQEWRVVWGRTALSVTAADEAGRLSGAVGVLGLYDRPSGFAVLGSKEREVEVAGGPWALALDGRQRSLVSCEAMSFEMSRSPRVDEDVYVQLVDAPPFSTESRTEQVGVLKEGFAEGGAFTERWTRVVIPLERLLRTGPEFMRNRLGKVIISGEGKFQGKCWIRNVRFHMDAKLLNTKGTAPK
jgi:hypothetical protein